MQVIDDPVVHRAAELRMRMQDDRDRRVLGLLRVIAAFQPPLGAGKDYLGHCDASSFGSEARAGILDEFYRGP